MGRPLRHTPTESKLVEITSRTMQGRYLLKPSTGFREIVVGCLARAQERYPVVIHAAVVLSNHYHLLLSVTDSQQRAAFMRHFNTNLSKEAGRLHGWRGPLFGRRYDAFPVSGEEAAQVETLRYILSQGCKEGLVDKPSAWPGLHSAQALVDGQPVRGIWYNRTLEYNTLRRGIQPRPEDIETEYELDFVPLPSWRHLPREVARRYAAEMVAEIEDDARRRHRRNRTRSLGVDGVLLQHPHEAPKEFEPSPKPMVHAATRAVRREMIEAYRAFERAFRRAAEKLKAGDTSAAFPPGSFPPGLPFVFDTS